MVGEDVMSPSTTLTAPSTAAPVFPMRRFSVDDYHRMIEAGVLTQDDPVELLEGWVAEKTPRSPRHDSTIELANEALRRVLPDGFRVRVHSAITTADSEPEPDLAVVAGAIGANRDRHPGPGEIALIVEVADSSVEYHRRVKADLYARAGIPAYWILNLVSLTLEAHTSPSPDGYRRREVLGGESVALVLDGAEVARLAVADLLVAS